MLAVCPLPLFRAPSCLPIHSYCTLEEILEAGKADEDTDIDSKKISKKFLIGESPSVLHYQDRESPSALLFSTTFPCKSIMVWAERMDLICYLSAWQPPSELAPKCAICPISHYIHPPTGCERSPIHGEAILTGVRVPNYFPITSHPQFSRAVLGIFLNLDYMECVHMGLLNLSRVQRPDPLWFHSKGHFSQLRGI